MARAGRELLTAAVSEDVGVDGVGRVLAVPELQETCSLQALLRFMEALGFAPRLVDLDLTLEA